MDFFDRIQLITEKFLTHRAKIRQIKREKRKAKNAALDWIEAFLWAASMVLLLNQYLIQAYRIPSGSMIDTLNIGDHVFVNKIVYGPELLPGFFKLPSMVQPKRNDIIIFENPSYISRGTVFDIAQRIIYMLTLSLVDIDKDETGEPRVHFLIKRAAGYAGDHLKTEKGEMKIRFAGEDRWVSEREYNKQRTLLQMRSFNHNITRLINEDQYPPINASGKVTAWLDRGIQPSQKLFDEASKLNQFADSLAHGRARLETLRKAAPHDSRYAVLFAKERLGWYVPEGRIFPMGDSRDNSRDGRYFGPVKLTKVLGKGMVIYWPARRMGSIK
ncbi:MAG: signal peptidase I [Treponema sp.]|nr:signal peptidase I [Treponema sp.]MCL2251187.1 signal peptidase I [Treponema sp.]